MYRTASESLKSWKTRPHRKPLLIRGARQVGKTWLMKNCGEHEFEQTVYINFDNNTLMKNLFSQDMDIERIITGLEIYSGLKIVAGTTLIILDEIQESPHALAALKYFAENAPQYHVMCAGSLLGVALHHGASFPVGKVEFLDLYPLSFLEFLHAMGEQKLADLIIKNNFDMAEVFAIKYTELLKKYYFIGGMPEVVHSFIEFQDFAQVRHIQQQILDSYEQDFSKHAPYEVVPRIRMLWNSIPSQLAKENKKFIYGLIREGSRAKEYEQALLWLSDCGLIHQVHRVSVPHIPLSAYTDLKSFKIYMGDIGLLCCMSRLDAHAILEEDRLFIEFKGALTEQYVLQQLKTLSGVDVYYWTSERATAEVDFLIDTGSTCIPIEAKATTNLKAKSLKMFTETYTPRLSVRTSLASYKREEQLINLPLWAVAAVSSLE